jgi:hypothetical protein
MYDLYDLLDYSVCREIAINYFTKENIGDFKVVFDSIIIKKNDQEFVISRPFTFVKDILRFSIQEYNDFLCLLYSVKSPLSVLTKLRRDIAIKDEELPIDPLTTFTLNSETLLELDEKTKQYAIKKPSYFKSDQINSDQILYIIKNLETKKDQEESKELLTLLAKLFLLTDELIKKEESVYNTIAKLEQLAYKKEDPDNLELVSLSSYSSLYSKNYKNFVEISKGFSNLYKNFLLSRKNKELNTKFFEELNFEKYNFFDYCLKNKNVFHSLAKNQDSLKNLNFLLDNIYVSVLNQLDTISSYRRHLIRAIIMNLKKKDINQHKFNLLKKSLKAYEKASFLLLKGFVLENPISKLNYLRRFYSAYNEVLFNSISFLKYLDSDKTLSKQTADVRKALIFYLFYISQRDIKSELENTLHLANEIKKFNLQPRTKKIQNYFLGVLKIKEHAEEYFKNSGLIKDLDPSKEKRKEIVANLKKSIEKLSHLPIHQNVAKLAYSFYESHTNYKFGPFYDKPKPRELFNPEILLIVGLSLLNRAYGEKVSLEEKLKLKKEKKTDQKLDLRIKELENLIKKIPFGNISKEKISFFIDELSTLYNSLLETNKNLILTLEQLSKKYLDLDISKLLFPDNAAIFFNHENDVFDQLSKDYREKNSFTNSTVHAKLIIEPKPRKKFFHQNLKILFNDKQLSFNFRGKDPTRLSIPQKALEYAYGFPVEKIHNLEKFLNSLFDLQMELNQRFYYLNKTLGCSNARYTFEHLNMFLGLLNATNYEDKGLIAYIENGFFEKPAKDLKIKKSHKSLTKIPNANKHKIEEYTQRFENERIFFMKLKRANRVFQAKNKIVNIITNKLRENLLI